jgi:hypothetical protein
MIAVAGLLLLAALPVFRHLVQRGRTADHCALDGVEINPLYQVRVRDSEGNERGFCCIGCALLWLGRQHTKPQAIYVTDEASGRQIEAERAYFVRSTVITAPTTGNRMHAFADAADALRHAKFMHGKLLSGAERPFAESQERP